MSITKLKYGHEEDYKDQYNSVKHLMTMFINNNNIK